MKNLSKDMRDVPVASLHEFGPLHHEVEEVELKLLSDNGPFRRMQLLCFERYLLAIEIFVDENFKGKIQMR